MAQLAYVCGSLSRPKTVRCMTSCPPLSSSLPTCAVATGLGAHTPYGAHMHGWRPACCRGPHPHGYLQLLALPTQHTIRSEISPWIKPKRMCSPLSLGDKQRAALPLAPRAPEGSNNEFQMARGVCVLALGTSLLGSEHHAPSAPIVRVGSPKWQGQHGAAFVRGGERMAGRIGGFEFMRSTVLTAVKAGRSSIGGCCLMRQDPSSNMR